MNDDRCEWSRSIVQVHRPGEFDDGWVGLLLDGPPAGWSPSVVEGARAKGRTVFVDFSGSARGYCRVAYQPEEVRPVTEEEAR
jgi:hypothetical protein